MNINQILTLLLILLFNNFHSEIFAAEATLSFNETTGKCEWSDGSPDDISRRFRSARECGLIHQPRAEGADLSGKSLRGIHIVDTILVDINFSNTNLEGAVIVNSEIQNSNFQGANMKRMVLDGAHIYYEVDNESEYKNLVAQMFPIPLNALKGSRMSVRTSFPDVYPIYDLLKSGNVEASLYKRVDKSVFNGITFEGEFSNNTALQNTLLGTFQMALNQIGSDYSYEKALAVVFPYWGNDTFHFLKTMIKNVNSKISFANELASVNVGALLNAQLNKDLSNFKSLHDTLKVYGDGNSIDWNKYRQTLSEIPVDGPTIKTQTVNVNPRMFFNKSWYKQLSTFIHEARHMSFKINYQKTRLLYKQFLDKRKAALLAASNLASQISSMNRSQAKLPLNDLASKVNEFIDSAEAVSKFLIEANAKDSAHVDCPKNVIAIDGNLKGASCDSGVDFSPLYLEAKFLEALAESCNKCTLYERSYARKEFNITKARVLDWDRQEKIYNNRLQYLERNGGKFPAEWTLNYFGDHLFSN